MRVPLGLLGVLLLSLGLTGASSAAVHRAPPRAELHVNGNDAKLGPWSSTWTSRGGEDTCVVAHGDGVPSYEPDASVDTLHSEPKILFLRNQKPRVQRFRAYSRLDRQGRATGPSELVDADRRRVRRHGEVVAWKLEFRAEVVDERYFDLDVAFHGDGSPCGNKGEASYAFALERE